MYVCCFHVKCTTCSRCQCLLGFYSNFKNGKCILIFIIHTYILYQNQYYYLKIFVKWSGWRALLHNSLCNKFFLKQWATIQISTWKETISKRSQWDDLAYFGPIATKFLVHYGNFTIQLCHSEQKLCRNWTNSTQLVNSAILVRLCPLCRRWTSVCFLKWEIRDSKLKKVAQYLWPLSRDWYTNMCEISYPYR